MRKSIALLLGLSLATLTACGQAPRNSGAASSDAASAVISEAVSDAAPATAETPAASSRDTTTEQRNVLDFTGMVLTGVPDKLVILNTVFTGKAG